ncbi:MAG: hypothetical protein AAF081_08960 [Actinomycetota bacterium]
MRLRRFRAASVAVILAMLAMPVLAVGAAAQEGQDTNGDGVADDFDGDGFADDLDGDCIPDDFNDDGVPDGDATDFVCPEGKGGTLPTQLSLQQIAFVLDAIFERLPDVTEPDEEPDGFPNIPRTADDEPDWDAMDAFLGEPGARDLLQEADNDINEILLEEEDINNLEFVDPVTGDVTFVATPEALEYTLGQIAAAGGDLGLIAGSGSALKGPCMGQAWSYDSDGQPLDMAFDFNREQPPMSFTDDGQLEQAFTSDNPFRVDVNGAVIFTGVAGGFTDGTGPVEHDWFINMNFFGFGGTNIDAGGDPNTNGENRNAGSVNLNEDLPGPAKINGLVAINGSMEAPGTLDLPGVEFFCTGSGFAEFEGGFPLSAPGAALAALATVGLLFNARPAKTWGGA